jgi:integrase/recombinase XerD
MVNELCGTLITKIRNKEAVGVKSGRHIIRRGYATKELADGKDYSCSGAWSYLYHYDISAYVKNNSELMMRQKLK